MRRDVSFDTFGNIVVVTDTTREEIHSGVVLLTSEQTTEAIKYGWVEQPPHQTEAELGLRRVRR